MLREKDPFREKLKPHVKSIYVPLSVIHNTSLSQLVGHKRVLYFSYGRYALFHALKACGIAEGDAVLVPELICRDLLSAIHSVGAKSIFYPVKEDLTPTTLPGDLPLAKAILAVNYFGFPQDLEGFYQYKKRTGAVVFEDNAHGLFSRDEQGAFLGARGDVGIYSIRKTLHCYNGAALAINNPDLLADTLNQDEIGTVVADGAYKLKQMVRTLAGLTSPWVALFFTKMLRKIRFLRCGYEIPPSAPDAELNMPDVEDPWDDLLKRISVCDVALEVKRRRELYLCLSEWFKNRSIRGVFKQLPGNTVPYAFPFFAGKGRIEEIRKDLKKCHLECFPWPELPDALLNKTPEFYQQIWFVSFLW